MKKIRLILNTFFLILSLLVISNNSFCQKKYPVIVNDKNYDNIQCNWLTSFLDIDFSKIKSIEITKEKRGRVDMPTSYGNFRHDNVLLGYYFLIKKKNNTEEIHFVDSKDFKTSATFRVCKGSSWSTLHYNKTLKIIFQ